MNLNFAIPLYRCRCSDDFRGVAPRLPEFRVTNEGHPDVAQEILAWSQRALYILRGAVTVVGPDLAGARGRLRMLVSEPCATLAWHLLPRVLLALAHGRSRRWSGRASGAATCWR
jgi:hypothetical protein